MRRLVIVLATFVTFSAAAQELPAYRFSVEAGAGLEPLHSELVLDMSEASETELAEQGIRSGMGNYLPIAVGAAWVFHVGAKTEITLTGSVSWRHYDLYRHPVFGTDPYGKPRYDTSASERMEKGLNKYCVALSSSVRRLWFRRQHVRLYSGIGLGLVGIIPEWEFIPVPIIPELIPFGIQAGGSHLYAFTEVTLGPHASLGRGGIGYRF